MFKEFTDKIAVEFSNITEEKEFVKIMEAEKYSYYNNYGENLILRSDAWACTLRNGFLYPLVCGDRKIWNSHVFYTYPEFLKLIGKDKPLIVKQDRYEVGDRVKIKSADQLRKEGVCGEKDVRNIICDKIVTISEFVKSGEGFVCKEFIADDFDDKWLSTKRILGKVIDTPSQSITLPPDVAKYIQKDRMTYVELAVGNSGNSYCNETDTFNRAEGFRLAYARAKKEIPQTVKGKVQPKPESKEIKVGDWVKLVDCEGIKEIYREWEYDKEMREEAQKGVEVVGLVKDFAFFLNFKNSDKGRWCAHKRFFVKIPTPKGDK